MTAVMMSTMTATWNHTPSSGPTTMALRHHYCHLSAPALEGAGNCRPSQMQELLMHAMMGL
jgi:hypothetical protein